MLNDIIQGASTAIPIIVTCMVVLYKFKGELCSRINELQVDLKTHIKLAESDKDEFVRIRERLTNVILKNNLKV